MFLEGGLESGVNFFGSHFKEVHISIEISLQLNQLVAVIVTQTLSRFLAYADS